MFVWVDDFQVQKQFSEHQQSIQNDQANNQYLWGEENNSRIINTLFCLIFALFRAIDKQIHAKIIQPAYVQSYQDIQPEN